MLWVLQIVLALLYLPAGSMKVFTLEKVEEQFPSMRAWSKEVWFASGILEIVCSIGLIVSSVPGQYPEVTPIAAMLLAIEGVVLTARHLKWKEISGAIWSTAFSAAAAFVAYGRW